METHQKKGSLSLPYTFELRCRRLFESSLALKHPHEITHTRMASLTNIRRNKRSLPLAGTMDVGNSRNTCLEVCCNNPRCVTPTDTVSSPLTIASIAWAQRKALPRDSFHEDITFTPEASLSRPITLLLNPTMAISKAKPRSEKRNRKASKTNAGVSFRPLRRSWSCTRGKSVWESCDSTRWTRWERESQQGGWCHGRVFLPTRPLLLLDLLSITGFWLPWNKKPFIY